MSDRDDRDAFLAGIAAAPWDDETPHLVFADWLDEHGEHEEAARQRQYVPSLRWMREFAKVHHTYGKYHTAENYPEPDYGWTEEMIDRYTWEFVEFLRVHLGPNYGNERFLNFDVPYEFESYSDEMWHHFEVLTGAKAPKGKYRKKQPDIRCAC